MSLSSLIRTLGVAVAISAVSFSARADELTQSTMATSRYRSEVMMAAYEQPADAALGHATTAAALAALEFTRSQPVYSGAVTAPRTQSPLVSPKTMLEGQSFEFFLSTSDEASSDESASKTAIRRYDFFGFYTTGTFDTAFVERPSVGRPQVSSTSTLRSLSAYATFGLTGDLLAKADSTTKADEPKVE
ncbi:MAG: hypothetical protein ACKO4T_06710 [Planctomycetaceae bacterium]